MPSRDTEFQKSARSQINAVRRGNFRIQMILLIIPAGILAWAVISGLGVALLSLFGSIIAFIVVSALIDRRDVCPMCRHKISSLPNEGILWLPGLSRKILACPFCGEDFDKVQEDARQACASGGDGAPF
jgi:hypothetical protein